MRVGIHLESGVPPERLIPLARAVEQSGLAEIWLAEDYYAAAAPSAAGGILASCTDLEVGIGAVPVFTRHPAVVAMEVATLHRMFPGRLTMTLAHGLPRWMAEMGVAPERSVAALRSRFQVIRGLLDGQRLTEDGHGAVLSDLQLSFPVPGTPLWLAVSGPRMLRMSAAIADGTLFSLMAGPQYVRWAREQLQAARPAGAGQPEHETAAFVIFASDEDPCVARRAARATIGRLISRRPDSFMLSCTTYAQDLRQMAAKGPAFVEQHMPDEWVDEFAVAGDPESCLQGLRRLQAAGLGRAILAPVADTDTTGAIRVAAELAVALGA